MLRSSREIMDELFPELRNRPIKDDRLFAPFQKGEAEHYLLHNMGIDGISSIIITKNALKKLLAKMGLDINTDMKEITPNHVIHSTLKTRFEFKKNYYVGRKTETKFFKVSLGDYHHNSLRDCLFIVFNTKELNEKCVKNKKKSDYYCKISLQGLHQPARELGTKMMECLHFFTKRIKISQIDLAVDVEKKGNLIDYAQRIKEAMETRYKTQVKITTPKFVANVEESCYFNVIDKGKFVKNIKFYDKYKQQTEKYGEPILSEYKAWHRIEMTIRNINTKYKDSASIIDKYAESLLHVIQNSGIMPKTYGTIDYQGLFNVQKNAMSDLKYSKKVRILPDVFLYDKKHREELDKRRTTASCYKINEIITFYEPDDT